MRQNKENCGLSICISLPAIFSIIAGVIMSNYEGKQMKNKTGIKILLWLLILSLAAPLTLWAQATDQSTIAEQTPIYSQEELDGLLAPIALYPDNLLSQFLMAATYPLEVVEADRWLKQNKNLTIDQLDMALQDKSWDVSVKSLCHFPDVLAMMSDKLTLTNEMGNAFLSQQEQVMNTIQNLRAKAQAQGNLVSTDKQKVLVQEGDISIEPVTPDVVYVPAYNPCWVYGPWWYPACAPLWFWYPGIVVGAGFFFGPPFFIGSLDGWCGFHWHRREMFVDVNKTFAVHRPGISRMHGGTEVWQHNPVHRRGIAYRNPETARRFGQIGRPGVEARREFRGFTAPGGRSAGTATGIVPQTRPNAGRTGVAPQTRPETGRIGAVPQTRPETARIGVQPRVSTGSSPAPQLQQPRGGNALDSFGSSGHEVRQNSERGHESIGGGSGGGMRGGSIPSGGGGGGGFHGGGRR
jgi:uncharacterized membrane protein YgcG